MKVYKSKIVIFAVLVITALSGAWAEGAELTEVRSSQTGEAFRVVIDSDEPIKYKETSDAAQTELVVFISGEVKIEELQEAIETNSEFIKSIELKKEEKGLEIKMRFTEAYIWNVFTLKEPHRLVIDLVGPEEIEQSWEIGEGIEYRYHRFLDAGRPVQVYVVEIQPGAATVAPVLAWDQVGKREAVSSVAKRYRAIAAVNGGYFSGTGAFLGNLKLNGEWVVGTSENRTAWGFTEDGRNIVGTLNYRGRLSVDSVPGWSVPIGGLNVPRNNDQIVLYNYRNGARTGSNPWGIELIIENDVITGVVEGNSTIYRNEVVLSAHGANKEMVRYLAPGEKVKIETQIDPKWEEATQIISAGPRLIENGRIDVTSRQEAFPSDISVGRAPRTAIGEMKDGTLWLIVVDGRSKSSVGMTLGELARYMSERGIYNAMNLDGGGSSAMVVEDHLKNKPSDGSWERPVSTAIIVIPKPKPKKK